MEGIDFSKSQLYSLCETLADLAYMAGEAGLELDDDSRETTRLLIQWAHEFEKENENEAWVERDYLDALAGFFGRKANEDPSNQQTYL